MKKTYICQCPFCKLRRYSNDNNDFSVMLIHYETAINHIEEEIKNLRSLGYIPTGLSTVISEKSTSKEIQGLRLSALEGNLEWYKEIVYGLKKDKKKIGISMHRDYK